MRSIAKIILITILISGLASLNAEAGIKKVAKRVNMISVYGGAASPTGSYDSFGSDSWSQVFGVAEPNPSIDGGDLYESTYHFGFDYGQLRNHRTLMTFGFRYTRAKLADSVVVDFPSAIGTLYFDENFFKVHLYDLEASFNYFLVDPTINVVSPYIGFGGRAGLMNFSTNEVDQETGVEYADENELKFTLTLNFGADLKLWEAPSGMSSVALSSTNSWDLLASGGRPRYLNIGGAVKYYFRP